MVSRGCWTSTEGRFKLVVVFAQCCHAAHTKSLYVTIVVVAFHAVLPLPIFVVLAPQVPSAWTKVWEGPDDSRKWLRAVVSKRVALTQWAAKVPCCAKRVCLFVCLFYCVTAHAKSA